MPVLSLTDISISFSGPPVLEDISLHVDRGERVCILGRNGAGKSTLLKVISGQYGPNQGSIAFPEGGQARALPQNIPDELAGDVFDTIALGFGEDGMSLSKIRKGHSEESLDPDAQWKMDQRIERLAQELGLELDTPFDTLSGGLKRRALLGQALAPSPAILTLDEPTNHMDLDSILWLEEYLLKSELTLLFVTHDRTFLRKIATRIIEVDLGNANSFRCDYDTYLYRKAELLEAEAKNRAAFDKKLSNEEAWLRKGIKARRTRNEGRVKALKKMREEKASQRSRLGASNFSLQSAGLSGRKALTASGVSVALGGKVILKPFDLEIMRGDRIGIVGPNGSGKTTLIRALLGDLEPNSGEVEQGTKLQVAYFDQLRKRLDDRTSVFDNIADGNESVVINGAQRHVISYLQDFLFTPDRARASIKTLSGGERNRLLLAKLFTQAANFIVLDEPTNDLDTETLELLEERIMDYPGTLLIVSHDRSFLENTVTSLIAIDKSGQVSEFAGGYEDWRARQADPQAAADSAKRKSSKRDWKERPRKFTKRERDELEALPDFMESLDSDRQAIADKLADPRTYKEDPAFAESAKSELERIDAETERAYARWEELETLKESLESQAT
ncbi:MAG: ABC transporter ATP-binding protein [Opitutales bacterium TMED158]|nr:MAG: ABC transporter ATP-binding protein [Opitutales bacterium TMED158]